MNKNGNKQGVFVPTPVNYTKEDGTSATWSGRGRQPKEIKAMVAAGTYVPPSVKAKKDAQAAKAAKRAEKEADKEVKTTAEVSE